MKRLSKIDESVWADMHKRSNGEIIKKEDGVKVHTCLGVDMVIKNKKCDYDKFIQDIMNHGNLAVSQMDSIDDLTVDEREEIRNWEHPYFYLISGNDSYDSDELVATFIKYNDLVDAEIINPNDLYEEDYIEMCRCISTKVRDIANYLEFIPMYNNAKMHSHYYGNYHPFLVKVSKKLDKDELTYFTEELEKQFPELDGVDFIYWYKYDETYLALPISFVTVMNMKDYIKFTKEWFSLNESVWTDIHKRSNGAKERREDEIITNINDITPVDVGNDIDVLWADRDLEINGETYLPAEQIVDFEMNGWRIPTLPEANDLITAAEWVSNKNNGSSNRFYKIGITHKPKINPATTVYFDCEKGKYAEFWSRKINIYGKKDWGKFMFRQDGSFFPHTAYGTVGPGETYRVRLVKDK